MDITKEEEKSDLAVDYNNGTSQWTKLLDTYCGPRGAIKFIRDFQLVADITFIVALSTANFLDDIKKTESIAQCYAWYLTGTGLLCFFIRLYCLPKSISWVSLLTLPFVSGLVLGESFGGEIPYVPKSTDLVIVASFLSDRQIKQHMKAFPKNSEEESASESSSDIEGDVFNLSMLYQELQTTRGHIKTAGYIIFFLRVAVLPIIVANIESCSNKQKILELTYLAFALSLIVIPLICISLYQANTAQAQPTNTFSYRTSLVYSTPTIVGLLIMGVILGSKSGDRGYWKEITAAAAEYLILTGFYISFYQIKCLKNTLPKSNHYSFFKEKESSGSDDLENRLIPEHK